MVIAERREVATHSAIGQHREVVIAKLLGVQRKGVVGTCVTDVHHTLHILTLSLVESLDSNLANKGLRTAATKLHAALLILLLRHTALYESLYLGHTLQSIVISLRHNLGSTIEIQHRTLHGAMYKHRAFSGHIEVRRLGYKRHNLLYDRGVLIQIQM